MSDSRRTSHTGAPSPGPSPNPTLADRINHQVVGFSNQVQSSVSSWVTAASMAMSNVIQQMDGRTPASFMDPRNSFWVTVDSPSYVGGQVLRGTVVVSCMVPFFAKAIQVVAEGTEVVEMDRGLCEGSGSCDLSTSSHHYEKTRIFRSDPVIVFRPEKGQPILPGQYQYTFSIPLPHDLPASFRAESPNWGSGKGWRAEVGYKIKVQLEDTLTSLGSQRIAINEPITDVDTPTATVQSRTYLTASGSMAAQCSLDRAIYFPGHCVMCRLDVNNTSTRGSEKTTIQLQQSVTLTAQSSTQTYDVTIASAQLPGAGPLFWGIHYLPIHIPLSAAPSTGLRRDGARVKCGYTVVVDCGDGVVMKMPLRVALFSMVPAPAPPQMGPAPPPISYRPPYQPDSAAPACAVCKSEFSGFFLTSRRHHCRACLRVVCQSCSGKKKKLPELGYKEDERVCEECLKQTPQLPVAPGPYGGIPAMGPGYPMPYGGGPIDPMANRPPSGAGVYPSFTTYGTNVPPLPNGVAGQEGYYPSMSGPSGSSESSQGGFGYDPHAPTDPPEYQSVYPALPTGGKQ